MNNNNKILPSKRLGKTIRSSRKSRGRKELSHPFSETVVKESHLFENLERMKWVEKCQDKHLWSVGVVKETIGIDIAPAEVIK